MSPTNRERELLIAIDTGDEEAIAAFDRRSRRKLVTFARHRGLTLEETEDVAQDTLLLMYRQLMSGTLKEQESFQRWMWTIFDRRFNDLLRKRYRERKALVPLANIDEPLIVGSDDERLRIEDVLLTLTLLERFVLLLNAQDGRTAKEIAPIVNLGVKKTEAILTQAKKRFRELMGEAKEKGPVKRLTGRRSS